MMGKEPTAGAKAFIAALAANATLTSLELSLLPGATSSKNPPCDRPPQAGTNLGKNHFNDLGGRAKDSVEHT